jgi:hypothetical protein
MYRNTLRSIFWNTHITPAVCKGERYRGVQCENNVEGYEIKNIERNIPGKMFVNGKKYRH